MRKIIKGFGDLLVIDDLTSNSSQFVEAVVQVACESPKNITTKIKLFIESYAYIIFVDVIGEVSEEEFKKSAQGQAAKYSEGSWSFDSSWEASGEKGQLEERNEEKFHIGHRKWIQKADYRKDPSDPQAKKLIMSLLILMFIFHYLKFQIHLILLITSFWLNGIRVNARILEK